MRIASGGIQYTDEENSTGARSPRHILDPAVQTAEIDGTPTPKSVLTGANSPTQIKKKDKGRMKARKPSTPVGVDCGVGTTG